VPTAAGGSSGGGGDGLLHQQAAWQQRLRVVQEALTLLRGLLVDDSTGEGAGWGGPGWCSVGTSSRLPPGAILLGT
jgi:hypothetical protein